VPNPRLSAVVPAYNEVETIAEITLRLQRVPVIRQIVLVDDGSSDGFAMDPELSAKIARCGETIVEVPIRYNGRSSAAGKKIRASDAVAAVSTLWRYRWWSPPGEICGS